MARALPLESVRPLFLRALQAGALRRSLTEVEWDIGGSCRDPRTVQVHGRPGLHPRRMVLAPLTEADAQRRLTYGVESGMPLTVTLHTRCRRCPACLRIRRKLWAARGAAESGRSARTWFGTLTLAPDEQYRFRCQAAIELKRQGVNLDELAPDQVFKEVHKRISREITLYLKRVRFDSKARLRFICVAEAHKSGLPHYHMLVHEVSRWEPVRYDVLTKHWRLGFSKWKLVDANDPRAGSYVAKYLGKSALARVRASVRYGRSDPDHSLLSIATGVLAMRGERFLEEET